MDKTLLDGMRILIVDDEPRLRNSLKTLLCTQSYEVKTCNSGDEALKYLKMKKSTIYKHIIATSVFVILLLASGNIFRTTISK